MWLMWIGCWRRTKCSFAKRISRRRAITNSYNTADLCVSFHNYRCMCTKLCYKCIQEMLLLYQIHWNPNSADLIWNGKLHGVCMNACTFKHFQGLWCEVSIPFCKHNSSVRCKVYTCCQVSVFQTEVHISRIGQSIQSWFWMQPEHHMHVVTIQLVAFVIKVE